MDDYSTARPVRLFTMPGDGSNDIVTDYPTVHKLIARGWVASRNLSGGGCAVPDHRSVHILAERHGGWPDSK
jgi:hypothetical protein